MQGDQLGSYVNTTSESWWWLGTWLNGHGKWRKGMTLKKVCGKTDRVW